MSILDDKKSAAGIVPVEGYLSATAAYTTSSYTRQLNGFLKDFDMLRSHDAATLDLTRPNINARARGVRRAWQYEKADIMMGGSGSEGWTVEERQARKPVLRRL